MSRWDPAEGHRDTMSFGPPERPRSAVPAWLPAAIVGLVVGLVVGLLADWPGDGGTVPAGSSASERPGYDIRPGAVETTDESGGNGPEFALWLLNRSQVDITVTGVRFDQLRTDLADVEPAVLKPGVWNAIRFAAPPDCFTGVPTSLSTARLTLQSAGERFEQGIDVPGAGRRLLDYQKALCASGGRPRPEELIGIWTVDDAFPSGEIEESLLVRFHPDGTFAADPEGVMLLDEEQALEGRYALRRGRLVIAVERGYAADSERFVWRATMVSAVSQRVPLMVVAAVGEGCPEDSPCFVWVMRRILDGTDTPGDVG